MFELYLTCHPLSFCARWMRRKPAWKTCWGEERSCCIKLQTRARGRSWDFCCSGCRANILLTGWDAWNINCVFISRAHVEFSQAKKALYPIVFSVCGLTQLAKVVFMCLSTSGAEGAANQAGGCLCGVVVFLHLHRTDKRVFSWGKICILTQNRHWTGSELRHFTVGL